MKKESIADGYTQIDNNGKIGQTKPVIEDTWQLLEGTDLRLRESRPRSDGLPGDTEGQVPQGQVVSDAEGFIEKLNKAEMETRNLVYSLQEPLVMLFDKVEDLDITGSSDNLKA